MAKECSEGTHSVSTGDLQQGESNIRVTDTSNNISLGTCEAKSSTSHISNGTNILLDDDDEAKKWMEMMLPKTSHVGIKVI